MHDLLAVIVKCGYQVVEKIFETGLCLSSHSKSYWERVHVAEKGFVAQLLTRANGDVHVNRKSDVG